MKYLALAPLILTGIVFAGPDNFHCKATYNLETALDKKVNLENTPVTFGGVDAFNFHLQRKADGRVELQASNMEEPSRSYATASIKNPGDNVELSIWTKYYLMEVRCTLAN